VKTDKESDYYHVRKNDEKCIWWKPVCIWIIIYIYLYKHAIVYCI
jgi:hypothetical protein